MYSARRTSDLPSRDDPTAEIFPKTYAALTQLLRSSYASVLGLGNLDFVQLRRSSGFFRTHELLLPFLRARFLKLITDTGKSPDLGGAQVPFLTPTF